MPKVVCEYCQWEQDTEKSIICDRCGRRLGKIRDFGSAEAPDEKNGESEPARCSNCGIMTVGVICKSCGELMRRRSV